MAHFLGRKCPHFVVRMCSLGCEVCVCGRRVVGRCEVGEGRVRGEGGVGGDAGT